jgi:ketosteroid isomerase-like protein
MIRVRRYFQMAMLWMIASFGLTQEASAVTRFASEELAAAARLPALAGAVAARTRLDEAFAAQDVDAVAALFADDLIVNAPSNRVARKEQVLGFFRAGRMSYESGDTTIESLDAREDQVVIMGEEVLKPGSTAPNVGTIKRRFTDVWRKEADGRWRLTIRQATITSAE